MATTLDYAEYVCRQLEGVGVLRVKKMFGEYCIYVNEKPLLLCCDNITYIAKDPAIAEMMEGAECGLPYPGAKERYVLDIDHGSEARAVVRVLERATPLPKEKKQNGKGAVFHR